jgi:Hint domain
MAQTNIIVNGSFDLGNAGWTGTDLETNYTENAYLGNGSTNRVAELDANRGQVTVMNQTVSIAGPLTTNLTFETALRTASLSNAGREGFRVDIIDSSGKVIATQTFTPTTTAWTVNSMPISFPAQGTYTIRLTELGPNDSLGAIIDDVSLLVCFTSGTMIDTPGGPRAVEGLTVGDLVWTKDRGVQPISWIGQRRIEVDALRNDASLRPITFDAGSLGPALPDRPLSVSPQHRLCLGDWRTELYFGHPEVLVPAFGLVNDDTIRHASPTEAVTYVHFLLSGHQIVRSNGVLTESFFPSESSLSGLDRAAQAEVLRLFPDLETLLDAYPQTARPVLRGFEARLVA